MITRRRSLCCTFTPTLFACLAVSLACFESLAADGPALIPQPVEMRIESGQFTLTSATEVLYGKGDTRLANAAHYLANRLSLAFGKKVTAAPTDAVDACSQFIATMPKLAGNLDFRASEREKLGQACLLG